eukprot:6702219-Pyramimonas_sp.AAC.1
MCIRDSPFPMGPADHVTNPSGSSETCNCRHFCAPQCEEVAGGSPIPMGPADHVTNPRRVIQKP